MCRDELSSKRVQARITGPLNCTEDSRGCQPYFWKEPRAGWRAQQDRVSLSGGGWDRCEPVVTVSVPWAAVAEAAVPMACTHMCTFP